MADVSDVTSTLVGVVSGLLYPNGTYEPAVSGVDARVVPGWPVPGSTQAALAQGLSTVSVYPWPGERNTTRYLEQWKQAFINAPTLTLSVAGNTVTVGGSIPPASNPHNLVIFVNRYPYVYAVQPKDTLYTIAAALSNMIGVNVSGVFSTMNYLVIPPKARLGACRVGITGTSVMEIARQEKQFHVIIWSSSPANRSALAKVIDPGLKALTFINFPDFTAGRIRYVGNLESDEAQKTNLYRRDLIFTVEYATTLSQTNTQITQEQIDVIPGVVFDAPSVQNAWGAGSGIPSGSTTNTADSIPLNSPTEWSADSPTVTMDETTFTSDAQPPAQIRIYQ